MKNIFFLLILFAANLSFAQKPDYNPNRDPIFKPESKVPGLKLVAPQKGTNFCLCCNKEAKNKPLIVLNGEIISNEDFDSIDPNKIESVTVWKEKKAVEMYGEKGKNGVIVIESKSNSEVRRQKKIDKKPPILAI